MARRAPPSCALLAKNNRLHCQQTERTINLRFDFSANLDYFIRKLNNKIHTKMNPIYLDYAATTPVDPRVVEKMQACLSKEGLFGNPSSLHVYGREAREAVEEARAQVAAFISAEPEEIIWTSGATESDNLAIKGAVQLYQRKGKHIITMKTEHKAVLDTCQHLEKKGYDVTYLAAEKNGLLNLNTFQAALRPDTVLVSIMHVNNETGVIQDINAIAQMTSSRGILLHVDAAQSAGKLAINLRDVPIDLLSLSAHKVYGPKGVGVLYLRKKPRVRVEPLIHGGGHEQGMRSGTMATHQVVGMGEAFYLAQKNLQSEYERITQLRASFLTKLASITNMRMNSDLINGVPHILNISFDGMIADDLLNRLPMLAASSGSACLGKGTEGSYVLRAMGFNEDHARSALRFSFGRFTTQAEVDHAASSITDLLMSAIISPSSF